MKRSRLALTSGIIIMIMASSAALSGCNAEIKDIAEVISSSYESSYTSSNDTESHNSSKLNDKDLQSLIDDIEIAEEHEESYDRDSYTSSSQYYKNSFGEEFTSIRKYSFYSSVHYDRDADVYTDPYDGNVYTLKQTDYDHIIPLHYANQHGADQWSDDEKKAYADDPEVGVDVNAHDNRAKGDKGPSEWLPSQNQDDYCYTWLILADKYDLSISQDDMNVIINTLKNSDGSYEIINQYY